MGPRDRQRAEHHPDLPEPHPLPGGVAGVGAHPAVLRRRGGGDRPVRRLQPRGPGHQRPGHRPVPGRRADERLVHRPGRAGRGGCGAAVPGAGGAGGRLALALLSAAGAGVLLVGLFPSDSGGATHTVGAILYLLGSGLGLIALAYGVRPRSEAVGTVLACSAWSAPSARSSSAPASPRCWAPAAWSGWAAYVLPIGLTVAAVLLLRQRDDWQVVLPEGEDVALTRRQRRELERAEAFDRARARDEALEAHAKKQGAAAGDDDDEPFDEEAAWRRPVSAERPPGRPARPPAAPRAGPAGRRCGRRRAPAGHPAHPRAARSRAARAPGPPRW